MPRFASAFKKKKKVFSGIRRQEIREVLTPTSVIEPRPSTSAQVEDEHMPTFEDPKVSSSMSKVGSNLVKYDAYKNESSCYDIINLKNFEVMLQEIAVCIKCQSSLSISTGTRYGLSVVIKIQCDGCGFEVKSKNSSNLPNSKKTDINVRTAYAFRCIGKGEESAKMWCGIMNLPKPPTFKYYSELLCKTTKEFCSNLMKDAVEECVVENDGDRDITVIFDGSWQKRGYSSLNGVVSAIAANTGKVIDVKVLSIFCRCPNRLNNEHGNNCIANYSGVSGGMEVNGVLTMFRESQPKYNVRYKNYLGDGDSASYPSVVADQPYGPTFSIEKLECVGHVQKRMGSRLRKLKAKTSKKVLSDGKTVGGKGRLTDTVINEIQIYYGLAIRRHVNTSVEEMKKGVWAEFFHLASSNEKLSHGLCPPGEDSWCKYRKAVAKGETYDHNKHTHLPPAIMELIKPIFRDLADPRLLTRCLHGGTQNPSESLNHIIWSRIPKSTFVQITTLEFGVYEGIATFNEGNITRCLVLDKLGMLPGNNCVATMKSADELRIKKANKAIEEIEKKCRQSKTLAKKRLDDMFEEQEDPDRPSYGAGMY